MSKPGFLDRFLHGEKEQSVEENTNISTEVDSPEAAESAAGFVSDGPRDRELEMQIVEKLREIFDPEIPVNIYELGLVYDVHADEKGNVLVTMTLTTPHCPVAESMPSEVEMKVRDVENVNDVKVELVWDPPWDMTMMSEAARLELGFM